MIRHGSTAMVGGQLVTEVPAFNGRAAPDADVSRCGRCGQWTWQGRCSLHPEGPHDDYPGQPR